MSAEDAATPDRPTNLVDLLAELVPPPEPAPVSLLPQTIGWPILGLLLVGLAVFASLRVMHRRRAEAYRKTALAALDAAGDDPAAIASVLRQTALTAYPRVEVAGLYGTDWRAFLEATCRDAGFQGAAGAALVTAPYAREATLPEATRAAVRHWITHHDRAVSP